MSRILAFIALFAVPLLAEEKRYLIIHADDAGMSHSVNRATIDAMQMGSVSSASIMVPCPWFPEFARFAREHPELDFGIHLTLNAEWNHYRWGPVADPSEVPSLVDEHGFLWDNVQQVAENVKVEEAEIELRAQIERARRFGVRLSHLDTHMGSVFARPDLAKLYVRLGIEYDLPVLFIRPAADNDVQERFPDARTLLATLDEHDVPVLDALFQFYDNKPHAEREQIYLQTLRNLPIGVSQIIIHCGYDDSELRSITSSVPIRDGDRRIFTSDPIRSEIKKLGIEVIGWKQFRQLQTNKTQSAN